MLCRFPFELLSLRCEMTVMPLETTYHQEDQYLPKTVKLIMKYLIHLRDRAIETQALVQPSSSKGSSFDDFNTLGPPYFSSTSDPTEAEVWILKIEKFFDVIDCSEEQKAFCAAFMLDKEANHWWRVVDRALIAEKDNKELQQYREQQRKRSKSDGAHDNQEPKRFSSIESHIKGEVAQNLDDCPENKKFIIGKPKKENKMDKQKPRVQGRMFATTHQDTQATSDVATGKVVKGFMPMWCEMEKILCSIIVQLIKV
ncbi:hypothetical protein CK203_079453 [Vitis vinifera]|uniref:Retrotransposon gag domain-containing protein n=1 Tax=Vitis vinifera TaxID=29760 RepID=A0A438CP02_VITVI|nr:hypothetical protein CK203_079453 [Vitis vinifera]